MTDTVYSADDGNDHLSWVRTRMNLDAEFREWLRMGFSLIVAGFGSFAFLTGILEALPEREGLNVAEPSRAFSLIATVAGILVILVAANHNRQMIAWINADEFGGSEAPELPQEQRINYMAVIAVILGIISFLALLVVV